MTELTPRILRSKSWAAASALLRAEFPQEYRKHYAGVVTASNKTQEATKRLIGAHRERMAEFYRNECVARGLPEPAPKPGRWPR